MLDLHHLGDQICMINKGRMGIAPGADDLNMGRSFFKRIDYLINSEKIKIMRPSDDIIEAVMTEFRDEEGNEIEVANKAAMDFSAYSPVKLYPNDILSKEKEDQL